MLAQGAGKDFTVYLVVVIVALLLGMVFLAVFFRYFSLWIQCKTTGAGISLIIFFSGLGMVLVGLCGYLVHAIREAESILPDHDELPVSAPAD